jgi:hypothetical protein
MRHLLIGVTVAATIAVIGPVWAQVPAPWADRHSAARLLDAAVANMLPLGETQKST